MNSLRMEQQSFRKLVEPFIWNYMVKNKLDDDDDNNVDDDNNDDDNDNDDNDNNDLKSRPRGW
jgi:hypothetical protein